MTKPMDFQTIILTLQKFWADQGCLIWQPYYTQVGAGTYNPATFLRVIGPEPWNVAYVEPSIRPDDGRYGENPNRLQQFYQFQVILKPDPGNPQEVYLRSLQALGIDPLQHDIRFVEDNWESPALGAWGLGWEVWLDGQEITQFTYFQQAGGITLDPVSVEITYGLERIAMTLQGVRNFRDIRWNGERTDGDVNLQGEQEHSKYYFELADVERLRQMYTLFESEAELSLANHLVLPAHDYVLKCSHTFNILDTRGAVGVTERQALFSRMRDLSRRVAEAYLEQREELGFPWVKAPEAQVKDEAAVHPQANEQAQKPSGKPFDDFLLEIGVEELPAGDLASALAQLRERVPAWLDEMRLTHGDVRVLGAPRRLVVSISDLAARQADRTSVVKGPPAARAYDAEGKPTKAAEGFAHSRGIEVGALELRELDGGKYVVATVHETGRPALDVLSEALPGVVAGIHFDKSMRWNSTGISFSRPIRWLLALLGGDVVPFEYAGLRSNRVTRGLRFHVPEEFNLASSKEYFECLKSQGILLDPEQRKGEIWAQVQHTAAAAGCSTPDDPDLLEEVTQLVEAPTALLGSFDPSHLELPPEVLISVMKKHQRYFPVYQGSLEQKKLAPHFIALRNGDGRYLDLVTDGNEQVIRARFADAAFFVREDVQRKLSDFLPRLSTLTFQVKLGSMLDKTHRIQASVEKLIERLHVNPQDAAVARRAAELCKADLVTQMVVEMTTLQGVMGRYYARRSGEPEAVAQAIYEHYLPRFAGDPAQIGLPGLLVGIADRLDTLSGLFAAGLAPSGTKDPFAQRRAALGLVQALQENHLDLNLSEGLEMAAANLPIAATPASQAACLEFIQGRMRSYLVEQRSFKYDVVDAVLAGQGSYPNRALQAVVELSAWVARPDWTTILPAYSRCVRITRDQVQRFSVDPAAFADPAEKELFQALQMAEQTPKRPGSVDDFLKAFEPMIPAVNKFFDAVLVMAEGERVRANRLGLLQRIAALPQGVADLAPLEGF